MQILFFELKASMLYVELFLHTIFTYLLTTRFPTSDLSATHVRPDWLLDWSLTAMWA